MQTLLSLHFIMVPLILAAGALTLIAGITLLALRRGQGDGATPTTGAASLFTRIFRIGLWVTAGFGVVQTIFGGLLFLTGARPDVALHFVYGALVLLAIPIAYVYSDQKRVRRDLIIMVIAVVVVIGAAVRALMTGGGLPH